MTAHRGTLRTAIDHTDDGARPPRPHPAAPSGAPPPRPTAHPRCHVPRPAAPPGATPPRPTAPPGAPPPRPTAHPPVPRPAPGRTARCGPPDRSPRVRSAPTDPALGTPLGTASPPRWTARPGTAGAGHQFHPPPVPPATGHPPPVGKVQPKPGGRCPAGQAPRAATGAATPRTQPLRPGRRPPTHPTGQRDPAGGTDTARTAQAEPARTAGRIRLARWEEDAATRRGGRGTGGAAPHDGGWSDRHRRDLAPAGYPP
ncbi:hypothetical protein JOF35_005980 [Streptomyces demainii]|uniref:Uncharacterized protein n=1 Tax=Streptomyces demainii TaxID=588122 RepID=A0ABT9L1M4_9ACTN|nr:hypothetical protein [Streptomyces demainii]